MLKINFGSLVVSSPAFEHGGVIPDQYTVAGEGVSPPLEWSGVPDGTVSFAIHSHDPDAPLLGGFAHWMIWGIPGDARSIEEGATGFPSGLIATDRRGWFPPTPLPGHGDHFYYFHLYALDAELDLADGCDLATFYEAVDAHVINQARVVGVYRAD